MADELRISVSADTSRMEADISNAARRAQVVIAPTINARGLDSISRPLGKITGQADEFTKSMEAANARVLAFGASVGVLNAVAKAFSTIVSSSIEVEKTLTEIAVASGESSRNLDLLGKGIFNVAKLTGTSFKDAANAALEFSRQGAGVEESLKRAQAALVLTRTTGLDAAESVKGLTAAVSSFNDVGLDYERVVNKLAAVDTKFAVSSKDLIEGITRSASVAQEAGVSFDELTALITTLQEKTARGGAVIGNALKTIFTRVQSSENLDLLRSLGIAVNDVQGNLLPATTIIKKLASEIQNLDDATRKSVLIKIGGGFQIDKLSAVLKDVADANGVFARSLSESQNAANQAFTKVEQLGKTTGAAFDKLVLSSNELASNIGKIGVSGNLKNIIGSLDSVVGSINKAITGGDEGETVGNKLAQGIIAGIGSVLSGPGLLLAVGVGLKLLTNLGKFLSESIQTQLGVNTAKKEQASLEKDIFSALVKNQDIQTGILSLEGNKAKQAEYILGIYKQQAAFLEKMASISKTIAPALYEGGIRSSSEGVKDVKRAAGGYMPIADAIVNERKNSPAGSRIIVDNNFPMGGGKRGTMVYNSNETRVPNFAGTGGDAIIPNYRPRSAARGFIPNFANNNPAQNTTGLPELALDASEYGIAGLTIGGKEDVIRARFKRENLLTPVAGDPILTKIFSKYGAFGIENVPVGNVYRRENENLNSIQSKEKDIKKLFRDRANVTLSPKIGEFIQQELAYLQIKPTAAMDYALKQGEKLDFVNDQTAGKFFEIILNAANMDFLDDNWGQFTSDSGADERSSFDIYNLKPELAKQYGLKEKGYSYVEVKASKSDLAKDLTRKTINELLKNGSLREKFLSKYGKGISAASGYIPNFAKKRKQGTGIQGYSSDNGLSKIAGRIFESRLRGDNYIDLTEHDERPDVPDGQLKVPSKPPHKGGPIEAKLSGRGALEDRHFGPGQYKGNVVILPPDSSPEWDQKLKEKKGSIILRATKFGRDYLFQRARWLRDFYSNQNSELIDYKKLIIPDGAPTPAQTAFSGYIPNFAELTGTGSGLLYSDKNFNAIGTGESGTFFAPKSGQGFGQKIFSKVGSENIQKEYDVNKALKDFENQNKDLFKRNAVSFTNVGQILTKNGLIAGFEREVLGDSGADEFAGNRFPGEKLADAANFAYFLSEKMAQDGVQNILKAYRSKYGPDSLSLYDIYAQNFKVNSVMQDYITKKTLELFKGGEAYSAVKALNIDGFNLEAGGAGGLHTMFDTMGEVGRSAAKGFIPNFATKDVKSKIFTAGEELRGKNIKSFESEIANPAYSTSLRGTRYSQSSVKNDVAASILGRNFFLSDEDSLKSLMGRFARVDTGIMRDTMFGVQVPAFKLDFTKIIEGEIASKARELKYEKLGQIFDTIAKNTGMTEVWEKIIKNKSEVYETSDTLNETRELTGKLRPVVVQELTKRLRDKISGFMTTVGQEDAEFLAFRGGEVPINPDGSLTEEAKKRIKEIQDKVRYYMPIDLPNNLKRTGDSLVDRIKLRDPSKIESSTVGDRPYSFTRSNSGNILSILDENEYFWKSFVGRNGRTTRGWTGDKESVESYLKSFYLKGGSPDDAFLFDYINKNYQWDPQKRKKVGNSKIESLRKVLRVLKNNGVAKWENIDFRETMANFASSGYIPNFADFDGDGTVSENDGIIKRLISLGKNLGKSLGEKTKGTLKNPIAQELLNQAIQAVLGLPEGLDVVKQVENIAQIIKAPDPENELKKLNQQKNPTGLQKRIKQYQAAKNRTAYSGFVPNFADGPLMDAIQREKLESGLPLSAISVVKDGRLKNSQNPRGLAVINKRDEPDGRVPNFAGLADDDPRIKIIYDSLEKRFNESGEGFAKAVENAAKFLNTSIENVSNTLLAKLEGVETKVPATADKDKNKGEKNPEAGASEEVSNQKKKEAKTVQDSLYNLLKFQTLLSFTSGALSKLGDNAAKIGESFSSLGSAILSTTEGFSAVKQLSVGDKSFSQSFRRSYRVASVEAAKIRRDAKNKGDGGGIVDQGLAAISAFKRTGGLKAVAGAAGVAGVVGLAVFEAFSGADKLLESFNGSIEKSRDAVSDLSEMQKKYGISLSESQKKLSDLSGAAAGSGTSLSGFLNRLGLASLNPFNTKAEAKIQELTGATGLSKEANAELLRTISSVTVPTIEQNLKKEEQQKLQTLGKNVPLEEIKIPSALIVEKTLTQNSSIIEEARKNALQEMQKQVTAISVPLIDKTEFKNVSAKSGKAKFTRFTTKIEDINSAEYKKRAELQEKINEGEVNSADLLKEIDKILESQTENTRDLVASGKNYEESLLYSTKYLQNQLDTFQELYKIQNSISSSEENLLKLRKENYKTSETEKSLIEFKLQKLEAERNLRSQIQDTILNTAKEQINTFVQNKGGRVNEEEAKKIQELYQNLSKVPQTSEEIGRVFNEFVVQLVKANAENTKWIENLQYIGKGLQNTINVQKTGFEVNQEQIKIQKISELINAKLSNEYEVQKQFLNDKLSIQQKGLEIAQEELKITRDIRDTKFERSLINLSPRQQQIARLERKISGIETSDNLQDIQQRRAQAALSQRSNIIQAILEQNKKINPSDLEGMNQAQLEKTFKENFNIRGKELDESIDKIAKNVKLIPDALEEGGKKFIDYLSDEGAKKFAEALLKEIEVKKKPQKPQENNFNYSDVGEESNTDDYNNEFLKNTKKNKQTPQVESVSSPQAPDSIISKASNDAAASAALKKIKSQSALPSNLEKGVTEKGITDREAARAELKSLTTFRGGFKLSLMEIDDEIDSFGNKLGKQIPLDFRNGLVDAMKALSDPNATTSLKERLMGVASAFLNKINEAFMTQAANKITSGLFGNGQNKTGLLGSTFGMSTGGQITRGSGYKDDVPAMLMKGEYVVKKSAVSKYGKSFLDKLNSGKIQGYADGGMVGFEEADLKDLTLNPTKYTPYGQTRVGNLSFDQNGAATGISNYTGKEQNREDAIKRAQSDFYAGGAQTGMGGFFTPGTYGQGAIMGQKNLLSFATQGTAGTQFDVIRGGGGAASIDIAGGSSNLSLFGLRNQENLRNVEYSSAQQKALDLYFGQIGGEKEKIQKEEEARKQIEEFKKQIAEEAKRQRKALITQVVSTVAMAAITAGVNSFSKGVSATKQAAALTGEKTSTLGLIKGGFTGGSFQGETRGGLFNMLGSGFQDFSVVGTNVAGIQGSGLAKFDSATGKYVQMNPFEFGTRYGSLENAGRLGYDALGTPTISGISDMQGGGIGSSVSKLNPMNWFRSSSPRLNAGNLGFGSGPNNTNFDSGAATYYEDAEVTINGRRFSSPLNFVNGDIRYLDQQQRWQSLPSNANYKINQHTAGGYAAGGYVAGNGMGDNVPAMLNGGEFVISRQAAQNIGYNNLQAMNAGSAGSGSNEMASRIELKLQELVEKVAGVGTINITVNSGKDGEKNQQGGDQGSSNQESTNRDLAKKIKDVVLNIIREEKRLGGMLR